MAKPQTQEKVNREKMTPYNTSHPSTTVSASFASFPSCSHCGGMANNTINKNNAISHNNCRNTKSLKSSKSSSRHPRKPDSVGTSLRIATQRSLEESILEMPKIPKKNGKAGCGGGSTNVDLGDEDSGNGGVGGSSDRSAKVQQLGEEPKVSKLI